MRGGWFFKTHQNTVNHHNLTDYTSSSENTTILTPAIFLLIQVDPFIPYSRRQWRNRMLLLGVYHQKSSWIHDDVIKWKYFPRYWPFVRGIHRSPVNSPHKGQWRGTLVFPLICAWINDWVNNREAGDLRRYRAHYNVTAMFKYVFHVALWGLASIRNRSTNKIYAPYKCQNRGNKSNNNT